MNHWAVQPNAFATGEGMRSSVTVLERDQTVICPKPRRVGLVRNSTALPDHPVRSLRCHFSHQLELCEPKPEIDILDFILKKEDGFGEEGEVHAKVLESSASPFICGSPPSRVANPLTRDARFGDGIDIKTVSSRSSYGSRPSVRIEGFDCLDRDSRNCSVPALA
ncbi:PREDICTED: uncharacterized protein LOC104821931 [Tarenaya hassleriana]|uniref:uncharacterized protein LOC104821931 n=1 Tax=Tarenaya hassleriana TaxID=28532 RepID=UPI00053C3B7A|nr:PREDICTED: uncharacterized protein LOC104821931 [Tarenaya hassleriana]XP_010551265.1 PREDICTED: uncharacterized protein LOC104821931 [Tarenaya hassleriana]XP_019059025.1 PREDICTED: uncharacterized protein LOC104821931 [Tarenaya hassleriana]XP_019059026.1 PREDICTED: uncharacterized protein LOC104821931 [Tarenaya hassleriana]